MKKVITIIVLLLLNAHTLYAYNTRLYGEITPLEKKILNLGDNSCKNFKASDIPTIFIPGILASWYQQEGYEKNKIKRWLPDPITHVYDPLFFTFKRNGYKIKDVFYKDQYNIEIKGNPKKGFYLFGYDWKKDNKITATILTKLVGKILQKYEQYNGCNIGKVNIIAHSMGGLVARSMLENMCVDLNSYDNGLANGKIYNFKKASCNNPYFSDTIGKDILVNNLITISTPNRGSPKSLPIWEKGNISMTDGFWVGKGLKYKLLNSIFGGDKDLYRLIHGYDKKIPNGIVTIGQLLPDLNNSNKFNDKLLYLKENGKNLTKTNYPRNSFLEELNKKDNINKIFDKITGKYISYYSTRTGNTGNNNIVGYKLYNKGINTTSTKDIYDKYDSTLNKNSYNIERVYKSSSGNGGDGTVPTLNLRLVANDSISGKQIRNKKFESKKVTCKGNDLYKGIGISSDNEVCSHANMTIATAYRVLKDIIGKTNNYNVKNHRLSLLYNLGYTNYKDPIMDNNFIDSNFIHSKIDYNKSETKYSLKLGSSLNIMSYEIHSPINIMIKDSLGRRIGIDPETGMIINEIPGAFTSGNTEGSKESEIFFIPVKENEKHSIKTYSTGNGEYHIVYKNFNKKNNDFNEGIIAGTAKNNFGENYIVNKKGLKLISKNISKNIPTTLEIDNTKLKTTKDLYNIKYSIRGNNKNIGKIEYKLFNKENKLIKSETLNTSSDLNIYLPNLGKYKIKLELLDNLYNKINNLESKNEINIEKIKLSEKNINNENYNFTNNDKYYVNSRKITTINNKNNNLINIYPTNDINKYFENKYSENIKIIEEKIKSYSFYKNNKLKVYIKNNREKILKNIKDDFTRKKYNFFLDKILEIIINNN